MPMAAQVEAVVSVAMEALTAVALGVGAGSSDSSRASCIGIVCGGEEAGGCSRQLQKLRP